MQAIAPVSFSIFYPAYYIVIQSIALVILFAIVSNNYNNVLVETETELKEAEAAPEGQHSPGHARRIKQSAFGDMFEGVTTIPAYVQFNRQWACGSKRTKKPGVLGPLFLCCGVSGKKGSKAAAACYTPAAQAPVDPVRAEAIRTTAVELVATGSPLASASSSFSPGISASPEHSESLKSAASPHIY
jgi:hypothetical protein